MKCINHKKYHSTIYFHVLFLSVRQSKAWAIRTKTRGSGECNLTSLHEDTRCNERPRILLTSKSPIMPKGRQSGEIKLLWTGNSDHSVTGSYPCIQSQRRSAWSFHLKSNILFKSNRYCTSYYLFLYTLRATLLYTAKFILHCYQVRKESLSRI